MSPLDLQLIKDFPSSAEYLTNIYLLQRDYGNAANHRLAHWMGVSTSAVTQALGRLNKLGLVTALRYGPATLTQRGYQLATLILKRHYLLENLLVLVLDYPWDKADEEAKILQNQISHDFAEHLEKRLGYPQTCPHGNPLPGAAIEAKLLQAPILTSANKGSKVIILRITEEGEAIPSMLPTCQRLGLHPGVCLRIMQWQEDTLLFHSEKDSQQKELSITLCQHIRFDYSEESDKESLKIR